MPFEPSLASHSASGSMFDHKRPSAATQRRIAMDRRAVRRAKLHLAIAMNMAVASGGITAVIRAAAHKKGPKVLLAEVHEAEARLHHDIARARQEAGGPKAPPLAVIRREHQKKTAEQAAKEGQAEAADTTGATASANDGAATGVSAADVQTASDGGGSSTTEAAAEESPDVSLSVDAGTSDRGGAGAGLWFLGLLVIGGAAYAGRNQIQAMFGSNQDGEE